MGTAVANLVIRTLIWLGGLAWWVYLRKPEGSGLLEMRRGFPGAVGVVIAVTGAALYVYAAVTIASEVSHAIGEAATLIERGPFRYVRNPLYVGAALVFFGVSTMYAPWGVRDRVAVIVVAVLVHLWVVRREEPMLRGRFGAAYADYCARVPRWFPKWQA